MYPHRIRLRGPWECEPLTRRPLDAPSALPTASRVKLPCRWCDAGVGAFVGQVLFRRRFGYPGRIDADERVWLTIDPASGPVEIRLNDHDLGQQKTPFEIDVTPLLEPRNRLEITMDIRGGDDGLTGEVAMEVRRTAYLRNVRLQTAAGRPCVLGQVVGSSDRPLELYVVGEHETLAYVVIEATEAGTDFMLPLESFCEQVQVELINVSTVWYAVTRCASDPPPR